MCILKPGCLLLRRLQHPVASACCNTLKDGEDIVCCSGPCKSQVHRYCAAVTQLTVSHFRSLQTSSSPFTCLFCTQTAFKTTVECLQSEIDKLRADVDKLKEAPEASRERQEVAPRVPPMNYSRAVTQPNQAKRSKRKKPPSSTSISGSSPLPGSSSVPGPSSSHAGVGEPVSNECTSTRLRARTKVDGARRIWGTMNQTSVKTVQNAISRFCKMDGLSIKRKTKTGSSKSSW